MVFFNNSQKETEKRYFMIYKNFQYDSCTTFDGFEIVFVFYIPLSKLKHRFIAHIIINWFIGGISFFDISRNDIRKTIILIVKCFTELHVYLFSLLLFQCTPDVENCKSFSNVIIATNDDGSIKVPYQNYLLLMKW